VVDLILAEVAMHTVGDLQLHPRDCMTSIGVGFKEPNANGLFHRQMLSLRSDFFCTDHADGTTQFDGTEVSVVWSNSSIADISAALEAGKHVLCEIPTKSSADWHRLFQQQRNTNGPRIFVTGLHRWDGQLRTVHSEIDAELGPVLHIQRISRQFIPSEFREEGGSTVASPPAKQASESGAFTLKWFEFLDELLLLIPQDVQSVLARQTGSCRFAWVRFVDGCEGYLELNQRSFAPLETGWMIEGTRAGYVSGKRFRAAADLELIDVPVKQLPTDQDAFYDALAATIRDGDPFPITPESMLRVLSLQDAIKRSLEANRAVDVSDR
jgi:predicted dehydrogenase